MSLFLLQKSINFQCHHIKFARACAQSRITLTQMIAVLNNYQQHNTKASTITSFGFLDHQTTPLQN